MLWILSASELLFILIFFRYRLSFSLPAMPRRRKPPCNLAVFLALHLLFRSVFAIDFLFNGFGPSDLNLYGNATIQSRILTLTNATQYNSIGRAFYISKIPTESTSGDPNSTARPLPFFTSFIFSITPSGGSLSGHGIAFLLTPSPGTNGTSNAGNLGLFNGINNGNASNHVFAVEFDVFQNPEFLDIDANHVGVDINSLTSKYSHTAGFWPRGSDTRSNDSFVEQKLNSGINVQVWIDYDGSVLNVTMARAGDGRPETPLISELLDLSGVLLNEMHVGFTGATGQLVEAHRILAWSFSNSNSSAYKGLSTDNLPSFVPEKGSIKRSKGFVAGISAASIAFAFALISIFLIWRKRNARRVRERDSERRIDIEEWELEYWPHRIRYQDIATATNGFSEENLVGIGGNGKVYRGVLLTGPGGSSTEVAVKSIPQESGQGMKEFLAEVSTLGRLKHRNLVGLIGWCKPEKDGLLLVYEYMENGSLDRRVFPDCCDERTMLGWEERVRVLKDIAAGLLYLHEGWESRVLHRDIKASNVMLDSSMSGRLGDFGLARVHEHGRALATTRVVGTAGYMAPEVVRSGRASAETDVYGFGVLVLEVACGRRPVEEGSPPLIEWVWGLMEKGEIVHALDRRVRSKGGWEEEEVERVLHLGLLCSHPEPTVRPRMRQVLKVLEGGREMEYDEEEAMEAHLLQGKAAAAAAAGAVPSWFAKCKRWSPGKGRQHPTLVDVGQSTSSSASLSGSELILEAR